jgi:hypothetical protein
MALIAVDLDGASRGGASRCPPASAPPTARGAEAGLGLVLRFADRPRIARRMAR